MDIHRSRFVPFPPSAINALAFSHAEPEHGHQEPESLRLAIGRANGNIEIWNPANGAWLQEKVFYGGKDRSVEGLAWTQEPDRKDAFGKHVPGRLRLFSIGYSSSVTEWGLASGLPLRHSNGNHSEVWCFAVQPRRKLSSREGPNQAIHAHQKLVAGCADGTIVLLSTEDDDLVFERFVSRATNKKARALSVAWKDQDTVLAGFADSMIRVLDIRNGNVMRNISLGSGPHGGPKEILVWKVKCLSNGDFVSGDSTGEIRIYNGKNFSQMQRISGHDADILDLAVSRDGSSIFSAGMDRRTCFYTSKKGSAQGQSGKWRKASHQRYHEHDVKALATYEGNKLSVVVSGGIDTQPIVIPLREFGNELSRGLPSLPHSSPLASAPEARLLVSWWNTEIRIWRVKAQTSGTERKPKVVARLALQGEENITSVSISRDGGVLAVATVSTVKLFQVLEAASDSGAPIRIRKLDMPTINGARLVQLTANGNWLTTVGVGNLVHLVRIVRTADQSDTPRALDPPQQLSRLPRTETTLTPLDSSSENYGRCITHVDFSRDGKVLAAVDLAGHVDIWVVEGHEDSTALEVDIDDTNSAAPEDADSDDDDDRHLKQSITYYGQRWVQNPTGHLLPRLNSIPVLLSIQPTSEIFDKPQPNGNPAVHPTRHNPHPHSHELPTEEYRLLVVTAQNQLSLFDVMSGRLSEWSRRNPPSSYPREFRQLDLAAKGCVWDVAESQQRVWLYGEKWLFMFDLKKDLPMAGADGNSKKRKRDSLKPSSGAGNTIPQKEAPVTKIRKYQEQDKDASGRSKWTDVHAAGKHAVRQDEDREDNSQQLAVLRRSDTQEHTQVTGDAANGEVEDGNVGGEVGGVLEQGKSWWHTFKYRPILGIVPISGDDSFHAPEVVLVERPSWDLDLPPKFVGTHEQ